MSNELSHLVDIKVFPLRYCLAVSKGLFVNADVCIEKQSLWLFAYSKHQNPVDSFAVARFSLISTIPSGLTLGSGVGSQRVPTHTHKVKYHLTKQLIHNELIELAVHTQHSVTAVTPMRNAIQCTLH